MNKASIPNPALEGFRVLIGNWETTGSHPLVPGKTLHGRSSFKWIEGGAFLMWSSEIDMEGFPAGIAIFGSDDASGEYFMIYFDERKVSRKYEVSIIDGLIRWWRNAPGFSQRYEWNFSGDENTITGKGELSRDGENWERDLDLTFNRVK